jgi:hypothetical protein
VFWSRHQRPFENLISRVLYCPFVLLAEMPDYAALSRFVAVHPAMQQIVT